MKRKTKKASPEVICKPSAATDKELQEALLRHCGHSYNLLAELCKRNGLKAKSFIEGKIEEIKEEIKERKS